MTTSGICELFTFAPLRSRKNGSASITSGWKIACALLLLCAASAVVSPAQTFRTVLSFDGANGADPRASLVQGLDGNLYGTTPGGGAYEYGTVFKMTPAGALTTLHSFCSKGYPCPDGAGLIVDLVQGTDGNFYGITAGGGSSYFGTVFKITPDGSLTVLHSFSGRDGAIPNGLLQASDGNFYGTTWGDGISGASGVFKITPDGTMTELHQFGEGGDGLARALVQARDGNFYGTTDFLSHTGAGTVFKMAPAGTVTTLHTFEGGVAPWANALLQARDGNFYGTTVSGEYDYAGTVFKMAPAGTVTTLHTFDRSDGQDPTIVEATDGNFYGTTSQGGANPCPDGVGCGTIFRITPSGTLTTLHSFNGTDGAFPRGGLVQATNGTFYGTTGRGGAHDDGTVFSLCVGLGWFTEELPNNGIVGATIDILGTDMTGASYVTFNGIAAPFTVVSPTLIQATVPPGATTGYVRVTLPSGRIPSNKKFRVTPQITSFTPTSGAVGTVVTITGVSLTQAWEVTIRGVHASFTVVDDGTVTATVPTGASTGRIRITAPGGAATTTTNFTVD